MTLNVSAHTTSGVTITVFHVKGKIPRVWQCSYPYETKRRIRNTLIWSVPPLKWTNVFLNCYEQSTSSSFTFVWE